MRTTLAIDDDILAGARHLAERDRNTVGEVVSALARQGLAAAPCAAPSELNGVPLLPLRRGAAPITPELVNRLRDASP